MIEEAERVIDAAEAKAMSREQTLRVLAQHGDEADKHQATMILAGPDITIGEEVRLKDWLPLPPLMTVAVRVALRSMARG